MVFSYDLSTDIGKVRLLIPDRAELGAAFQDADIAGLLALEGDVRRAAALGLESIASDTAIVLRVTETLGMKVNGAQASDAILKRAAELRKQAAAADPYDGIAFDIAEMAVDDFSSRDLVAAAWMRGEG